MPQNLKELKISEVSLVDFPANSSVDPVTGKKTRHAVVAIWKRDDTEDVEKYSHNQARDTGKWKSGGGVGKDQHAAENAETPEQHDAAAKHHETQSLNTAQGPISTTAHTLASIAHAKARDVPSKANSRAARDQSRVAGHFTEHVEVAKAEGIQFVIGFPEDGASKVQTILFDKDKWDEAKAVQWLKDNGFDGQKADDTGSTLRYQQVDPEKFDRFRTITPGATKKVDDEDEILKAAVEGKTVDGQVFPSSAGSHTRRRPRCGNRRRGGRSVRSRISRQQSSDPGRRPYGSQSQSESRVAQGKPGQGRRRAARGPKKGRKRNDT